MRRWIAIFLLLTLPLQALWGAAEPYCQHEQGTASQHMGHHVHDHSAASPDTGPSDDGKAGQAKQVSAAGDHDNHCCSAWSLLPAVVLLPTLNVPSPTVVAGPPRMSSVDPARIERPQWLVLS